MANTVIYQKRGDQKVKVAETPDLSPYAIKTDVDAELAEKADADDVSVNTKSIANIQSLLNGAISTQQTDTDTAYTKTVPSGAQPYAAIDAIGGKTVVWNQIIYNGDFSLGTTSWGYPSGITITVADNVATMTVAADGDNYAQQAYPGVVGHKYLLVMDVWSDTADISPARVYYGGAADTSYYTIQSANTWETFAVVFECATNQYNFVRLRNPKATTTTKYRNVHLHDLTSLYEAGNEPTTVAEFQSRYPASYYAYDPGSLKSAAVTGAVSVGKNLCDLDTAWAGISTATKGADGVWTLSSLASIYSKKIWENDGAYTGQISVQYERKDGGSSGVGFRFKIVYTDGTYDSVGTVSRQTEWTQVSTVSSDSKIVSYVDGTYNNSIECYIRNAQIELGSTATAYTPYMTSTLPIPSAVQQLPGYGWSAGTAYNYVDWERKVYVQRVASVDLGTLGWNSITGSDNFFYTEMLNGSAKPISSNSLVGNILCAKYVTVSRLALVSQSGVISIGGSPAANVQIRDTEHSPATMTTEQFRTYISGTTLYYELATPIETDISAYLSDDNLIEVEPGGSVTFPSSLGDDYRLPVPSDVEYTIDLAPDTPTTDGTYTLQCTVADGVATYEWVSA